MPVPFSPRIDLRHAPTIWRFYCDNDPIRIIRGPLGSGKTTGCCGEVMRRALMQQPNKEGLRLFKAGIVRNTMPQLKSTTIQTWLSIFPEDLCGPIRYSSPALHHIRVAPKDWKRDLPWDHPAQGTAGLDLRVEFFALDTPKDVRNLLSYEGTMIWFNEIREIPKPIMDMAPERVGRYPSEQHGGVMPTWFGVIGDTNPPDKDHWIFRAEEGMDEFGQYVGKPLGWRIYDQPAAVVKVIRDGGIWIAHPDERMPGFVVENPAHVHEGGRAHWAVNPGAENLANLRVNKDLDPSLDRLGRGSYYATGLSNKGIDWIECYLQGRYGFVREGKPVVGAFDAKVHVFDDVPVLDGFPIIGGADIGGNTLNPAGVFGQHGPRGVWMIHNEIIARDMGLQRFSEQARITYRETYKDRDIDALYCDPAGRTRDGIFETVAFDHLISQGWPAFPAPNNDIATRVDAITGPCTRLIDGKPGLMIHRRCVNLIAGLSGKWQYRRLNVSGSERYSETPSKDHPWSDVCDGLGYMLSGGGETRLTERGARKKTGPAPVQATVSFDVFNN